VYFHFDHTTLGFIYIGILPRDGKNISFKEMGAKVRVTYNFASTFCFFVPNFAANMLSKSYGKDTFDLAELDLHNETAIEHDASLTRKSYLNTYHHSQILMMLSTGQDKGIVDSQAKPHIPFVDELLASATGKDSEGNPILTLKDLAAYSSKRRVDARATNPEFTLNTFHKLFGSSK
jgi:Peroxidase, family 2